jgi:hypothetical protein
MNENINTHKIPVHFEATFAKIAVISALASAAIAGAPGEAEAHPHNTTGGAEARHLTEAERVASSAEERLENLDTLSYRNGLLRINKPNKHSHVGPDTGGVEAGNGGSYAGFPGSFENTGMADPGEVMPKPVGAFKTKFINRPLWLTGRNHHKFVATVEWDEKLQKPKIVAEHYDPKTMHLEKDQVGAGEVEKVRFNLNNNDVIDLDHPLDENFKPILGADGNQMLVGQKLTEDYN